MDTKEKNKKRRWERMNEEGNGKEKTMIQEKMARRRVKQENKEAEGEEQEERWR